MLQLVKRFERGDMTQLDWLDNLAFRQIEKIHKVFLAGLFIHEHHTLRALNDSIDSFVFYQSTE